MGLDTVELVMEVEEVFAISIPDADAEKIETVGQLHEYILVRLPPAAPTARKAQPPVCTTARCFYRVRAALIELIGLERKFLTPQAPLESLLPNLRRRQVWRQFEQKLQMHLPKLERPWWVGPSMTLATFLVALFVAIESPPRLGTATIAIFFAAWFGLLLVGYVLTQPMATAVPLGCPTLGELVRNISALNYRALVGERTCSTREDVWEMLRAIIVEQFGVKPSEVRPEASFVKDLGAD